MHTDDTIVAIATPPGQGGIGVVRLSGPASRQIGDLMLRFPPETEWQPREATLAELMDEDASVVDRVVATHFAAPRSYTGEEVVEISCHGSPVVLRHCVDRALRAGARLAEPGEFTLRAYLNGRIDLPQAEAVRDLIHATTLHQAKVAAQQLKGAVSLLVAPLKEQLLQLIALLEAGIDFADDDIDVAGPEVLLPRIDRLRAELQKLIESFRYGKLVHDGFTLAIVGRPNTGKSSLFNRLLERDRAIVTDIPGTTRDTVSEVASIAGIPVRLLDTAGIRESADTVEKLGIERTWQAIADADITIIVIDLSCEPSPAEADFAPAGLALVVGNKKDLPRRMQTTKVDIEVSALTGEGIEALRTLLLDRLSPDAISAPQAGFLTSLRHELLLKDSIVALERAAQAVAVGLPHEMLLLDCYAALQPIDALTGATTADDILNRIFSTFCIGK